jgi:quercetin dioxygenase-like cupin family protein
VTIQWFFASEVQVDPADAGYVVRRNARTSVHYEDGIVDELLSPQPTRQLEILHSRFPPGAYSQQSYSHDGEEAGYILSGTFELWVGERHFRLGEGDSFSYASQEPHRYGNPGTWTPWCSGSSPRRPSEPRGAHALPKQRRTLTGRIRGWEQRSDASASTRQAGLGSIPEPRAQQTRQTVEQPLQRPGWRAVRPSPASLICRAVSGSSSCPTASARPGASSTSRNAPTARLRGDFQEVEQVHPGQHRLAQRRRFQQVVPAVLDQAAADEGDIGQGIEEQQLAHGVAEQHRGLCAHPCRWSGAPWRNLRGGTAHGRR